MGVIVPPCGSSGIAVACAKSAYIPAARGLPLTSAKPASIPFGPVACGPARCRCRRVLRRGGSLPLASATPVSACEGRTLAAHSSSLGARRGSRPWISARRASRRSPRLQGEVGVPGQMLLSVGGLHTVDEERHAESPNLIILGRNTHKILTLLVRKSGTNACHVGHGAEHDRRYYRGYTSCRIGCRKARQHQADSTRPAREAGISPARGYYRLLAHPVSLARSGVWPSARTRPTAPSSPPSAAMGRACRREARVDAVTEPPPSNNPPRRPPGVRGDTCVHRKTFSSKSSRVSG